MRRRPAAREPARPVHARGRTAILVAAVVLLGGCTATSEEGGGAAPSEDSFATIDPFPTGGPDDPGDASAEPTPTVPPSGSAGSAGSAESTDPGDVVVTFSRAEALNDADRETIRTGGIPAVLREPDGPGTVAGTSTELTCRDDRQETVDVPVARDGLLRLRASVGVVARLSGDRAFTALALDSDRAVLVGLDRRGRVRSRASANQIDERWFVREVEDCR